MHDLDIVGDFWLAPKPDHKVAGRLTFNTLDGLDLNLIGSLDNPNGFRAHQTGPIGSHNESVRILGQTNRGPITLGECRLKSGTYHMFGSSHVPQETYRANWICLGTHFSEDQPLVFSGFNINIQHLEHWLGLSALSIEVDYQETSKEIEQIRIVNTPLDNPEVESTLGRLELLFESVLAGDHIAESTIKQNCSVQLSFTEDKSLEDTLKLCTSLQSLVTIGVDTPVSINRISLIRTDVERTIDFVARLISPVNQHTSKPPDRYDMLFTYEDMGGLEAVARWIGVAGKYQLVIAALLSPKYRPPFYTEHRFFDAFTAAETFWHIRKSDKHINRHKFKQLGLMAGDEFKTLVGDVGQWTERIWDARRDSVVHRGLDEDRHFPIHLFAESLYFMVMLCLLKESVVSNDALSRIQQHERFQRLARELERS